MGKQKSDEANATGRLFLSANTKKETTIIYPLLPFAKTKKTKSHIPSNVKAGKKENQVEADE